MAMMMFPPRTIVLNPSTVTTGYDVKASAGNPVELVNCYLTINNPISSNNVSVPALTTGTWRAGSRLHIVNNSTITGATGANGTNGNNGIFIKQSGGAGGDGNNILFAYNMTTNPGGPGSPGTNATVTSLINGTNGTNGINGGISFSATTSAGLSLIVNNLGSFIGGTGGTKGLGGTAGRNSGGGGGGGGGPSVMIGYQWYDSGLDFMFNTILSATGGGGGGGGLSGAGGNQGTMNLGGGYIKIPTWGANGSTATGLGPGAAGGAGGYETWAHGDYVQGGAGGNGGASETSGSAGGAFSYTYPGNYDGHTAIGGVTGSGGPAGTSIAGVAGSNGNDGTQGNSVSGNSNIIYINTGTRTGAIV